MKQILIKVWHGSLSPCQAIGKLKDKLEIKRWSKKEKQIKWTLNRLEEKLVTINEAKEKIQWTLTERHENTYYEI